MQEEKSADEWKVVLVAADDAKCRECGGIIPRGDRAWYRVGHGLQHLEHEEKPAAEGAR